MMFVCEDDKSLRSSFFLDLGGLLDSDNTIPINIVYHAKNFYDSQMININRNTYTSTKIDRMKINYKNIKVGIEKLYADFYIPGKKNILYYGGHSYWLFENQKYNFKTKMFENIRGIELLILDSCYTSYTNLLSTLIGKTKYVMACSTASPNLGFLTDKFINILNKPNLSNVDKYKKLIDMFIIRNSATDKRYKPLNYRTDGSLIDMNKYVDVFEFIEHNHIPKEYKCKIEQEAYYYFYDLLCLTENAEFKYKIKDCILYTKMNALAREFFKKKNISLSGMIIGIR